MKHAFLLPVLCLTAGGALAGTTPPGGPPWQRDLHAARKQAILTGKPIFLYFTKTV